MSSPPAKGAAGVHPTLGDMASDYARRALAARLRQGLAACVTDPETLDKLAVIMSSGPNMASRNTLRRAS
jgi:hypothetical protein